MKVKDFYVPPLSVQPLVENAIKHGILKRVEGGSLVIKSFETDKAYVVQIIDDGIGFNMDEVDFGANKHFGLNNIKSRLKNMCNGNIEVNSAPDIGTTVSISFYK